MICEIFLRITPILFIVEHIIPLLIETKFSLKSEFLSVVISAKSRPSTSPGLGVDQVAKAWSCIEPWHSPQ